MRVRFSTFAIVLAAELAVLTATFGVVRELRLERMRASCLNGLNEQVTPRANPGS